MGCGDECPYVPAKHYIDWELDDPAGRPFADVRRIRDQIGERVDALAAQLGSVSTYPGSDPRSSTWNA